MLLIRKSVWGLELGMCVRQLQSNEWKHNCGQLVWPILHLCAFLLKIIVLKSFYKQSRWAYFEYEEDYVYAFRMTFFVNRCAIITSLLVKRLQQCILYLKRAFFFKTHIEISLWLKRKQNEGLFVNKTKFDPNFSVFIKINKNYKNL